MTRILAKLLALTVWGLCSMGADLAYAQQAFAAERGHVEFRSSVPLHSFSGRSDHLTGRISLADSTVDFYVDLTTLKTGNGKRDKDMRKTLKTKEYPFAEFFGTLTTPFDSLDTEPQRALVRGIFKIHGIERELEVAGTLQLTGDELRLNAAWELSLADYEIKPPRLLIIKVADTQRVSIETELKRETTQ
ncbi:MAG: YceI family protein [Rhodothermales bacterium]|nr:YceI family protein [Rhodothermales bacterium]